MTCDKCPDPAVFIHTETACMRNHCGECFARCRACMDDLADSERGVA